MRDDVDTNEKQFATYREKFLRIVTLLKYNDSVKDTAADYTVVENHWGKEVRGGVGIVGVSGRTLEDAGTK